MAEELVVDSDDDVIFLGEFVRARSLASVASPRCALAASEVNERQLADGGGALSVDLVLVERMDLHQSDVEYRVRPARLVVQLRLRHPPPFLTPVEHLQRLLGAPNLDLRAAVHVHVAMRVLLQRFGYISGENK